MKNKTFDLKTFSLVSKNGTTTSAEFFKKRIKGLAEVAKTNKKYKDENYQNALKSIAGTYGMLDVIFEDGSIMENIEESEVIETLSYTYFAYAIEQLEKEGKAGSETEALAIALEELLTYFTGENIENTTFTVDNFIELFAKYISENDFIADKVISGIVNIVPEDKRVFLAAFKGFDKNNIPGNEVTTEEGLKAFIKACYKGADPECIYANSYPTALSVRNLLCMTMVMALSSDIPEISTIFLDENWQITGKAVKFEKAIELIMSKIKTVKNEQGTIIKNYSNMAELAEDKLVIFLDKLLAEPIEKSAELYGQEYKNELRKQVNTLKENITEARKMVSAIMFYADGGFNTKEIIENFMKLQN